MADEIHLSNGTIIGIETGETLEPPRETHDWRVCEARTFLTSRPGLTSAEIQTENAELRRLLRLVIDCCDDWAVTEPESPDYVPTP